MSKMSKNENMIKTFEDIPPHVIVFEILTYWEYCIEEYEENEGHRYKDCVGYFNRDRARNCWFIFRTIEILSFVSSNFLINWGKVENISISVGCLSVMEFCKNFYSLIKLKIYEYGKDCTMLNLFKNLRFPKLKYLRIPVLKNEKEVTSYHRGNFTCLKKFKCVYNPELQKNRSIFGFSKLKSLKINAQEKLKKMNWNNLHSLKNLTWAKGRVEPRRELAMRLLFCMEKLEEKLHPRQQKDLSLSKSPGTAP